MKYLLLTLAFLSFNAFAEKFQDGNWLLSATKEDSTFFKGVAYGYIDGIADLMPCIPVEITKGQLLDVVKNYLEQNPAIRHEYKSTLVIRALNNAFPCKQEIAKKSKNPT